MKRKATSLVLAIFLLFTLATTASAYEKIGYSLIGGVYNRTYYYSNSIITHNNITVDYASSIEAAITDWNVAVNATSTSNVDVAFSKTSSASGATVFFSITNRGATGFAGITRFLSSAGYYLAEEGDPPTADYAYSQIILNVYYIHQVYNTRRNVVAHEFGHALGLMHSNDSSALMWDGIHGVSGLRPPTNDDIMGVRDVYS